MRWLIIILVVVAVATAHWQVIVGNADDLYLHQIDAHIQRRRLGTPEELP